MVNDQFNFVKLYINLIKGDKLFLVIKDFKRWSTKHEGIHEKNDT